MNALDLGTLSIILDHLLVLFYHFLRGYVHQLQL